MENIENVTQTDPDAAATPENGTAAKPENRSANPTKPAARKMATIKLHKDNRDYKEDKIVLLNGRQYIIQRGVEVKVPVGVAEILKNEERMLEVIAAFEEKSAEKLNGQ